MGIKYTMKKAIWSSSEVYHVRCSYGPYARRVTGGIILSQLLWFLDTLRPRRNGHHFPDDIFICISLMHMYEFWLRFHWGLYLMVQLPIFQYWIGKWFGAGQMTSHCLNHWCIVHWHIYASLSLKGFLNASRNALVCRVFAQDWINVDVT